MLKRLHNIYHRVLGFLHLSLAEKCRVTFGAAVVLVLALQHKWGTGLKFMRIDLKGVWQKLLKAVERRPLSLAEKCRVTFGAAVVLVLALALLLPYIWMGQLTKKASLDAGRARTDTLLERHFQPKPSGESKLAVLDNAGNVLDANDRQMRWIRFEKGDEKILAQLSGRQREMIEVLGSEEGINDNVVMTRKGGSLYSSYVRIIRATENCINCHNPQGTAVRLSARMSR